MSEVTVKLTGITGSEVIHDHPVEGLVFATVAVRPAKPAKPPRAKKPSAMSLIMDSIPEADLFGTY